MKSKTILIFVAVFFTLSSCEVFEQFTQMQTFSKCDFKLKTVENLTLAGVNVQNINSFSDVNLLNAAKITAALASGKLPLSLTLNVDVKNPNQSSAAMNKLEWIFLIDDIELVRGITNNRVEIPANGGVATLPLYISTDLKQSLSGKSGDALLNFGFNLAGAGNKPSRISLKAKPSIVVANQTLSYPGYITVNNEFGGR